MEKSLYQIFKTFFKVGTLLLGGGYVILPLLTSELVEKKKWITSDELCEYYALGASLPGIIAINTAIFTGRKLAKTKGAIAATVGMIFPAFIAIILLASLFMEFANNTHIQNIFWGVGIGIIVLLFSAVKEMLPKAVNSKWTLLIYLVCLILTLTKICSLYIIVLIGLFLGILPEIIQARRVK